MPNWVDTSFEIQGPRDEVKRFLDGIKEVDGNKQIISSYLPIPEELNITSTSAYEEIPEKWAEWVKDGSWTQEDYDKRVEENNTLLAQQKANIAKYGHTDWYDWCCTNWGTKWGDCHTDIHTFHDSDEPTATLTGSFDTAWGPADQAFITISKMFPTLLFTFTYDEEAGFFAGIQAFRNGEEVFESLYVPADYGKEVDWDDEESWSKFQDWKMTNLEKIENEYDRFITGGAK